ncbi:MAG: hypothetical protein WCI55_12615 [Armatimonadota bacterium]
MKPQLLAIIAIFSLAGCGKPDPKTSAKPALPDIKITAENQRTLFPFAVGNTWTYAIEIVSEGKDRPKETRTGEIQYKVTKVSNDSGDSVRATLAVMQDGKQQDEQDWSCDSKGIFQLSSKSSKTPYSPKQPVIRFPVKDQDEFKWEGTGITPIGKQGKMEYAFKNDGIQKNVDTEMESMPALFMQSAGKFMSSDGTAGQLVSNSWFSPGVGLIRYRQVIGLKGMNSAITLRLKSYNVKK